MTRPQLALLKFISVYIEREQIPPTIADMCIGTQSKSKSTVHGILSRLQEQGYVSWRTHRARSVVVLRKPGEPQRTCPSCGHSLEAAA